MERARELLLRSAMFFVGMALISLGSVLAIKGSLGVVSWDVLHVGLAEVTPLSIGTWTILVGVILIIFTMLLGRRPSLGCIVNMLYIGPCIDLFLLLGIPTPDFWLWRVLLMLAGIFVVGFGTGMYVVAKFGEGPRDGFTLALAKRIDWPIGRTRIAIEIVALTIGWMLGGPVFVGTLAAALGIGPIMHWSLKMWQKWITYLVGGNFAVENFDQRPVRANHHDGFSQPLR